MCHLSCVVTKKLKRKIADEIEEYAAKRILCYNKNKKSYDTLRTYFILVDYVHEYLNIFKLMQCINTIKCNLKMNKF